MSTVSDRRCVDEFSFAILRGHCFQTLRASESSVIHGGNFLLYNGLGFATLQLHPDVGSRCSSVGWLSASFFLHHTIDGWMMDVRGP